MGGVSTSHSAVLRDQKTDTSSAFNLRSWQGLTQVLKAGKDSLRDAGAYAEFRNLVLQYAQQGGDKELREKIDAVIATFSKNAPSSARPQPLTVTHEGGKHTAQVVKKDVQEPKPHSETLKEKVVSSSPLKPDVSEKASKDTFIVSPRRIQPFIHKQVQPKQEVRKEEKVVEEKIAVRHVPPPKPIPTVVPEAVVPVINEPLSVPTDRKTLDEYKARIMEIKRAVNAHVGNPAMLVDVHNELGRKYMSALLSALKTSGGNGTEDIASVMMRLEEAYTALVDAPSANTEEVKIAPPISEEPKEEIPVAKEIPVVIEEVKEEEIVEKAPPLSLDIVPEISSPAVEIIPPEPTKVSEQPSTPHVSAVKEENKHSASQTLASLLTSEVDEIPETVDVTREVEISVPKEKVVPQTQSLKNDIVEPPAYTPNKHTSKSVGTTDAETLMRDSGINSAEIAVKQSELASSQITDALHQLLHEWSIFGGSGLFGIGPGGSEHPLYRSLAPLSMGEVIAGRWEKADPKVTKIIKQYVDAWRHEQGVAYTINETFEHYLRRVVQRILKRQNS